MSAAEGQELVKFTHEVLQSFRKPEQFRTVLVFHLPICEEITVHQGTWKLGLQMVTFIHQLKTTIGAL